MFTSASSQVDRRLNSLEKHLQQENPVLLQVVQTFRELDQVAYRMGVISRDDSFATRVSWWPLISILGTFSSGKSTFINAFIGQKLQRTGNQAVDDKFTVICYSKEEKVRTLPGLALDADPRFPFYQISQEIENVVQGEGKRIDAYLQLKTCLTEKLRGKILIDSPGFDADAQRTSTLRITDHIMSISDLVLVFFDARHPEPGAMKDTLDHLVKNTINRADSNKFLFILNQMDCTVREDNLEDVTAAWQRSLSQSGLTAGRFYQIYNLEAALPIDDDTMRTRYENKRREDMDEIDERIRRVEVERAYRIIGVLEHTARQLMHQVAPKTNELLKRWRKNTLLLDCALLLTLVGLFGLLSSAGVPVGTWLDFQTWVDRPLWVQILVGILATASLSVVVFLHFLLRKLTANLLIKKIPKELVDTDVREYVENAFARNTRPMRPLLNVQPAGWGRLAKMRIEKVLKNSDMYVQNLNDQFTNPSGRDDAPNPTIQLDVA
ncbi:MAG: dynamin family protein [Magnetococcales bacterium]|nr:dynamin family protein [Magnetococcales bacterium]